MCDMENLCAGKSPFLKLNCVHVFISSSTQIDKLDGCSSDVGNDVVDKNRSFKQEQANYSCWCLRLLREQSKRKKMAKARFSISELEELSKPHQ